MNPLSTRLKVSDIAPTTLRLQPEVRDELAREARINNRSLSAEITARLQRSLRGVDAPYAIVPQARESTASTPFASPELPDEQRALLSLFKALGPEKQLALLTLLRQ